MANELGISEEDLEVKQLRWSEAKTPDTLKGGPGVTGDPEFFDLSETLAAIPRGAAGALESAGEIGNVAGLDYDIPENLGLGTSQSTVASGLETVTQFFLPFGAILKGLGGVSKASKVGKLGKAVKKANKAVKSEKTRSFAKYTTAGILTDAIAFDGLEGRLSDWIESVPELSNPITDYLASDTNDTQAEGRFKNAVEGMALGSVIDLVVLPTLGYVRKVNKGRLEGKSFEDAHKDSLAEHTAMVKKLAEFSDSKPSAKTETIEEIGDSAPVGKAEEAKAEKTPEVKAKASPELKKLLKDLTYKPAKGKSALDTFLDDIADINADPQKAIDDFIEQNGYRRDPATGKNRTLSGKHGIFLDINSMDTVGDAEAAALAFTNSIRDSIIKSGKKLVVSPELRKEYVDWLERNGLVNEATMWVATGKTVESDATLLANSIAQSSLFKSLGEAAVNASTIREQLNQQKGLNLAAKRDLGRQQAIFQAEITNARRALPHLSLAIASNLSARGRALRNVALMRTDDVSTKAIEEIQAITDNFLDAQKLSEDQYNEYIEKVATLYKKHGASSLKKQADRGGWLDLHNEVWINSLLSGPKTFFINTFGPALTSVYLPLETMVGAQVAALESSLKLSQKAGRKIPSAESFKEVRRQMWNRTVDYQMMMDAIELGMRAFKNEESILSPRSSMLGEFQGGHISGSNPMLKGLSDFFGASAVDSAGKLIRTPSRAILLSDEFNKQIMFRRQSMRLANIRAYELLEREYGEALTPAIIEKEQPALVHDLLEGIIRENGERYSQAAVRREGADQMFQEIAKSGRVWNTAERQNWMSDYFDANYDATKGELSNDAMAVADEVTFTTPASGMTRDLQQLVVKHPVLRNVMPFISTPMNLIKFVGQRTAPFEILPGSKAIHKRLLADLESGDPVRIASARGRQAMGTAFYVAASMMAAQGLITGRGPSNAAERRLKEETGWKPYAFNTPFGHISYQRVDPFASFFGAIADFNEFLEDAQYRGLAEDDLDEYAEGFMLAMVTGLSQNVINKSYMTGLKQALDAISQPEERGPTFLRTRAGSYVPAFFGQMVGAGGDDAIREARTWMEAMQKRVPFAASALDPRRNVLGEVVKRTGKSDSALINWGNPIMMSGRKRDRILEELVATREGFSLPKRKIVPGVDMASFQNNKGQSAYDRWLEIQGTVKINRRTLRQELARVIESKAYQALPSVSIDDENRSPRAKKLKAVIYKYRSAARDQVLREFPNMAELVGLRQTISANESLGTDTSEQEEEYSDLLRKLKGLR